MALIFSDNFTGTTIDTTKWTETDPASCIAQNDTLNITNNHTAKARFANKLQSVSTVSSSNAVAQAYINWTDPTTQEALCGMFLYKDANNYAYVGSRSSGGTYRLLIQSGGSQVYTLDGNIAQNKDVKITFDGTSVKFWYWNGSAWTQMGTTQTYNLGANCGVVLSTEDSTSFTGADVVSFDNLYLSDADYSTQYPITTSIKTINGLAIGSVKTVNGLAVASMKTFNGLS